MQKLLLTLVAVVLFFQCAFSQVGQWGWIKGDSIPQVPGVYGAKGVPSPANKPGARRFSLSWTDTAGNFWLFGGSGYDSDGVLGYLNDLWKFNPNTNQWAWMSGDSLADAVGQYGKQGVTASSNKPPARRRTVGWTDKSNKLWLFGGNAVVGSYMNDLWNYNIATNQWTWVNGDTIPDMQGRYGVQGIAGANMKPGARYASASWMDTNNRFWLFGGLTDQGMGQEALNDLWMYDLLTNQWTWMKGDSTGNSKNVFGTKGIAAPANTPGARAYAIAWRDADDDLWLFGGDLWKFSTVSRQWTWVGGDSVLTTAVYGVKGTSSPNNKPGSRNASVTWRDTDGNLWMFGGAGVDENASGYLNDLWKYDTAIKEWTWVGGDNHFFVAGIYGTQGTFSAVTKPGSRAFAVGWKDAMGNLWVFGGEVYLDGDEINQMNDLWKYSINSFTTAGNGNWNSPSTWIGGIVPPANANVVIKNTVYVTANVSCYTVSVEQPTGALVINPGVQLTVSH